MVIMLARNWWTLALRGLVAMLFGMVAFVWPRLTLVSLTLLFGFYALADGILALVTSLVGSPRGLTWWDLRAEGVLGITIGVVTLLWPGWTVLALLYLIAAWAITTGALEIALAVRLRKEIRGEWLLAPGGLLSMLLGIGIVLWPRSGVLALTWLIGAYALLFGFLLFALAVRLRAWARHSPQVVA